MAYELKTKHSISVFALIMMAVVSVDSLRNIPISAQYGLSLISFYVVAGLLFFFPLAWITAKLTTEFPQTGGSYLWVKTAFGGRYATLGVWLQWIYNLIWYPTIFAFTAGTLADVLSPYIALGKTFILSMSLILFWGIAWFHSKGIKSISLLSIPSAIIGALLPMTLMILFAGYWLISGHTSATSLHLSNLIPGEKELHNLGFFSNILFSLLGLEVIAIHAGNVKNPQEAYPKTLWISSMIILLSITLSSLALCIIMPSQDITLVNGMMDVIQTFFATYHLPGLSVLMGLSIVIGSLGIAASWMIGMARSMHVALQSMNTPAWLVRLNQQEIPSNILWLQAVIYTGLLTLFLLFPNINSSYWILSAVTSQFALLYYLLIFSAAMQLLRYRKQTSLNRILSYVLPLSAIVICLIGIIVGFLPPDSLQIESKRTFEAIMLGIFGCFGVLPILVIRFFR